MLFHSYEGNFFSTFTDLCVLCNIREFLKQSFEEPFLFPNTKAPILGHITVLSCFFITVNKLNTSATNFNDVSVEKH